MAGDLNTRIIISARDDASTVFLATAKNLGVVGDAAKSVSQSLGGAMSTEVVARKMAELTGNLASVSRYSQAAGKDVKLLDGQLAALASQAGLTQKEFAGLYGQMMKTQASKAAADGLRAIGEAAGLSQREVTALGRRMGLTAADISSATRAADAMGGRLAVLEGVVGRVAVALGAWKLADMAKDAAMAAARYDTLGVVMEVVGKNSGIAKETMNATAASLQKQGIAMVESRDAAVKLTQAGIDLARATELGRVAQDAAVIAQMNSSEAFSHMVAAIQSAQPEMLRTLGMNVSFEDSYRQMAAQMGKSAEALTEQEKMQARVNAVMEAGQRISGTYEASMGTAGKQISSMTRYLENLKTVGGQALQEGLANSVEMATKKIKELTEYLQTGEARDQIAAIGKSGEETFRTVLTVAEAAGTFFSNTASGWSSLPTVIQEVGLVAAVVGGPKAVAALGVLASAAGEVKRLRGEIADTWAVAAGVADDATKVRELEADKKRINESWMLTDSAKAMQTFQLDKQIAAIRSKRQALQAEQVMLNDSLAAPKNNNTAPVIPQTWGDLIAEKAKISGAGGESSLSDETRTANAKRAFETRYALSQRMYKMAQGDSAKMAEAVAVERDAHHALGVELESINAKHKKAGEEARKSAFTISEAMNKALGASESWTGDAWSGKFRQLLADLDKDLKAAKTPIEEYWAYWEYGAKKARVEFDQWIDSIKRAGELESQIGQLSFDPGRQFVGDRAQLTADWQQAVKAAGENQEEIARVNELYQLKEVELREKSLGDLAALDDGYFERRKKGLEAQFEHLKKQGVNEHALAVHMAQERDKLNKEQLEKRLGYEDDFGSYLMDRLNLQYGLYKSAEARKRELWEKSADATIKMFDGVTESVSWALGQVGGDLLTNKFKDVATYTEQLLGQLKQTFATWLTEMVRLAASRYIIYPIMGQVVGTSGSISLPGASGMNVQGGDGASLGDVTKYAGYAKDAYNMVGGSSSLSALSSTSTNAFMGSLNSGGSIQMANISASNATQAAGGGFGSALGAGAVGGSVGYLAGGLMRPDNPMPSYVGAGVGLAAGTAASMAGIGAGSALATTLGLSSLGGPIGIAAGLIAATVMSLATPNTTKSSWNTQPGSGQAVMVVGGDVVPASYGVLKQTTSGMFGSSSTKHQTVFQAATGQMAEQEKALWTSATAGVSAFTEAMGLSAEQVKDATKNFVFPLTAVPEGMDPAIVFGNVATAFSETLLDSLGMKEAVQAVAIEGESWADTLTRISTALQAADAITVTTGFDFERLTGSMDKIQAGNYISRFAESAGGIAEVQTSLGLMTTHTMTAAQRAEAAVANATSQADSRLVALGVSFEDFWDRMQETMSGPVDPDVAASWMSASKLVDQLNTLQKTLDAVNLAARQFDASLSARALSAQGFTYQAQAVSMLAAQEAELTQARIDGATATQLARIAEVQALEQAALARQRAEQGDSIRSGLASRIATATGDDSYWMTEAVANKQKDYFKIVWEYGYDLANMSNRAYDLEIQARLTSEAEAVRLSREAFALDIQTRQLALAGRDDEAGAMKLVAEQAEQYRNAIASGLGADDLDSLLQVQRDELADYWDKLVDNLKSAADAVRKTVLDLRAGDKSALPVGQRYDLLESQFESYVAKGMTGDRDAISSAQSLAPQLLDALMAITTDQGEYANGFNGVTGALSRLADVLVGVQQKDAIAQAESSYNQALSQAATAFSSSFQGGLVQQMATTAMGWSGGIDQLMASSYWPGGNLGWRADYSIQQGAANITDFAGWFKQNYGLGSGEVDWWGALQKWIQADAANPQLSKSALSSSVLNLYSDALAALERLKAVRGFATGGISSGPQLAMVSEGAYREEAHVPLPDGRTIPVTLRGGDGNSPLLAELRSLREEVRQLRQDNTRGQFQMKQVLDSMDKRERRIIDPDGILIRTATEGILTRSA